MRCPKCGHNEARVTDSRDVEGAIRRRRECLKCGDRFTTYERIEIPSLWVVKRDGRRERFSREKLAGGLLKACAKRPVSIEAIEKLVEEVEATLQAMGRTEVPSAQIGELVMERLQRLDQVAYIRFASVYRKFEDLESFRRTLDSLLSNGAPPKQSGAQLALLPEAGPVVPVQMPGPRRRGRKPRVMTPPPALTPGAHSTVGGDDEAGGAPRDGGAAAGEA